MAVPWERLRDSNADYMPIFIYLARHYEKAGEHPRAQQLVKEILRLDPGYRAEFAGQYMALGNESPAQIAETVELMRRAGLP